MKNSDETIFSCIGLLFSVMVAIALSMIWGGWVLTKLWEWFISPVFGIGNITIAEAAGMSLIVNLFANGNLSNQSSEDEDVVDITIRVFIKVIIPPLVVLIFGWVVAQFL